MKPSCFGEVLLSLCGYCHTGYRTTHHHRTYNNIMKKLIRQDGIAVDYRFADGDAERRFDRQLALLRMPHSNAETRKAQGNFHLFYTDLYPFRNDQEYSKAYSIAGNSQKKGACSVDDADKLTIFSKWTPGRENKRICTDF